MAPRVPSRIIPGLLLLATLDSVTCNIQSQSNVTEVKHCVDLFSLITASEYDMIKSHVKMYPYESSLINPVITNGCNLTEYLNLSQRMFQYKYNIQQFKKEIELSEKKYEKSSWVDLSDSLNQNVQGIDTSCCEFDIFFDSCPQILPLFKDNMFEAINSLNCAKIFVRRFPEDRDESEVKNKIYEHVRYGTIDDYYSYVSMYPKDFENNIFKETFIESILMRVSMLHHTDQDINDRLHLVQDFLTSFPNETNRILRYIIDQCPHRDMKHHIDEFIEIRPEMYEMIEEYFFTDYVAKLSSRYNVPLTDEPYFSYFPKEKSNQTKQLILLGKYKTHQQIDKFLITFPEYKYNFELIKRRIYICCYENIMVVYVVITFVTALMLQYFSHL